MTRRHGRQDLPTKGGRLSWLAALAAVCLFGLLATTPLVLKALHVATHPVAATSARGDRKSTRLNSSH